MFSDSLKKKCSALFQPDKLKDKLAAALQPDRIKQYGLDFLLYFVCCLPFLRILPIPSDVQPYAFIVAVIYLIVHRRNLRIPDFHKVTFGLFLFVALLAIGGLIFDPTQSLMMLIRKTYNYAGLYVISLALVNSLEKTKGVKENWIKGLILLWLFVGLMQLLIDRQFLSFLVSNYRTTVERGVAALASEPSFYGCVMVFFFIIADEFKTGKWLYKGICLFQIVVLAQSAVTFVYLAVFAMIYVIKEIVFFRRNTPRQKKTKLIIAAGSVVVVGVAAWIVLTFMQHTRFVQVFVNLFSNLGNIRSLQDLYAVDESVAVRLEAIVVAFQGFGRMWGLPNGFGQILISGQEHLRIMSGYGAVIYELGVVGILLVAALAWWMIRGLKNGFVYGIGITIIMFSAIQLGSPVFILVFACALYAQGRNNALTVNVDDWCKKLLRKKSEQ